ncbi:MAG: sulfurtransferase TusA family protein [Promethearchaeota archaeon]
MNDTKNVQKLDIRGKVCPMTFVYTKLALEKMNSGDLLEITLDFPAAVENVPNNCERQNLGKLLEIKTSDDIKKEWILLIKKI